MSVNLALKHTVRKIREGLFFISWDDNSMDVYYKKCVWINEEISKSYELQANILPNKRESNFNYS